MSQPRMVAIRVDGVVQMHAYGGDPDALCDRLPSVLADVVSLASVHGAGLRRQVRSFPAARTGRGKQEEQTMNHPCEDHNSRDCGVCHRPVRVTTATLPAACEGELRDLARAMRRARSFASLPELTKYTVLSSGGMVLSSLAT